MNPFVMYLIGPGGCSLAFNGYDTTVESCIEMMTNTMSKKEVESWAELNQSNIDKLTLYDLRLYDLIVHNQEKLSIDLTYEKNKHAVELTRRQYYDSLGNLVHRNFIVRTNLKEGRYWVNPLLFMYNGKFLLVKPPTVHDPSTS